MHTSTKPTNTYTLDVILSVGYRVKFRRWVTALSCRLAENPALARRLASKIRRIRKSTSIRKCAMCSSF